MYKKILVLLILLALVLLPAVGAYAADVTVGDYVLDDFDTAVRIKEYKGSEANLVIPSTINVGGVDKTVVEIGTDAFAGNDALQTVTIPGTVENIGRGAFFNCGNLTSVVIPASLKTLGVGAFMDCVNLRTVSVVSDVSAIPVDAFNSCEKLREITLGENVTSIAAGAFVECASIETITVGGNLASIAPGAFDDEFFGVFICPVNSPSYVYLNSLGYTTRVLEPLYDIEIASTPAKMTYQVGESLELTGLTVMAIYDTAGALPGEGERLDVTALCDIRCEVASNPFTAAGRYSVSVSYEDDSFGYSKLFYVTVSDAAPVITSIAVKTNPAKTVYFAGETLNTAGLSITVNYSDGSSETKTTGFTASPQTLNTAGTKTITVGYEGFNATFTVTVKENVVERLIISNPPNVTEYRYKYKGGGINLAGLVLIKEYSDGSRVPVTDLSSVTVSGPNLSSARRGTYPVTLTLEGKTASFNVTIKYLWWQWLIMVVLFGWVWY
ncbi:MAG: bacterial Ig-like domain-containing protein [Oscillospiraceae bacterium]|nr:bacterial Ig-like domain-containing protein [Oscillospiraceae bacterium]